MSVLDLYRDILDKWTKEAGPRPTKDELEQVHLLGECRPGSKDAFAVAMALRAGGATQNQIIAALGRPHRNKIAALVAKGTAVRITSQPYNGATCYKIEFAKSSTHREGAHVEERANA